MLKKKLLPLSLLLLTFSPYAFAGKMTPYLGLQAGYSHLDVDGGDNLNGYSFGLKGVAAFKSRKWFFDPGLGIQAEKLNGDEDFMTISGFGELDLLYRFSPSFSVGPVTSLQFGGNQSRNGNEDGSSTLFLAGLRLMLNKEDPEKYHDIRYTFDVQRSFAGDEDNSLYAAVIGIQFGFPGDKPKHSCAPCGTRVIQRSEISDDKVNFAFDSSKVEATEKDELESLSRVLKARDQEIMGIRVEGHADERGERDYNQALSERRAEAVKEKLVEEGVTESKITTIGHGEDRPKDAGHNEEAWAKNRRTEIIVEEKE